MKRLMKVTAMGLALLSVGQARAGIPVIDGANLFNSAAQVVAWGKQYTQMATQYAKQVQQFQQAVQQYQSLNGVRGMGALVNNPAIRRYLPNEWGQAVNLIDSPGGFTGLQNKINSIRTASQLVSAADTGLNLSSNAAKMFVGAQNQAAINRALSEEGYKQASHRITAIQSLIDKVDDAPDAKDVADLQARIQAEQAMVQNEMVKLAAMGQLQQAQRDLMAQQSREVVIQAGKGGIPRF